VRSGAGAFASIPASPFDLQHATRIKQRKSEPSRRQQRQESGQDIRIGEERENGFEGFVEQRQVRQSAIRLVVQAYGKEQEPFEGVSSESEGARAGGRVGVYLRVRVQWAI
jgi:hypothetical protein